MSRQGIVYLVFDDIWAQTTKLFLKFDLDDNNQKKIWTERIKFTWHFYHFNNLFFAKS